MFPKIQSFLYGFGGVRLALARHLIDFFNNGIYSVTCSKDIPGERITLAHLSLPLIGEGEVCTQNRTYSVQGLTSKYGWGPLPLNQCKVDALFNGMQLTTAYSVYNLIRSFKLIEWADSVAPVST